MKQIQIKIYPNGEIQAETLGIKGRKCMQYIPMIEKLTNAVVTDSDFTPEYLETEVETDVSNSLEVDA